MSIAFIDADLLVYRCAFVAQTRRYDLVDKLSGVTIQSFRYAKNKEVDVWEDGEKVGKEIIPGYNNWIEDNIEKDRRDTVEIRADWDLKPISFAFQALDGVT